MDAPAHTGYSESMSSKVAILSDIHDNIPRLREALVGANEADVLICCGDLCSPFIVKELGKGFTGPIHVVFGNNDGDRFRMLRVGAAFPHIHFHGEFVELELGGLTFAVNHFDDIGRALARGGKFDVVCYGHNHQYECRQEGPTLVVNPGEVFGLLSGVSSWVMLDTVTRQAERRILD